MMKQKPLRHHSHQGRISPKRSSSGSRFLITGSSSFVGSFMVLTGTAVADGAAGVCDGGDWDADG